MFRKQITLALVALALVFATASQASADCRKKIALEATAAGAQIDASGTTEVRSRGAQQRFKVSMDARVADATTFNVFVNGLPQPAGTITIVLGVGELDINNNNGNTLPAGVDPVCSIKSVEVKDGSGTLILSGSF
ncbi:MAG: hypothetical protein HY237_03310 [Acidobacteria bacterium]|nr:hypothetical protein [Acidobacteriota bacterium]